MMIPNEVPGPVRQRRVAPPVPVTVPDSVEAGTVAVAGEVAVAVAVAGEVAVAVAVAGEVAVAVAVAASTLVAVAVAVGVDVAVAVGVAVGMGVAVARPAQAVCVPVEVTANGPNVSGMPPIGSASPDRATIDTSPVALARVAGSTKVKGTRSKSPPRYSVLEA
jgi:hypothetical protein